MTQRQEFTVLRTYKDFEIREYLPCVLAEVKVSQHHSSATSIAFGSLFKYISKGNQGAQKIAMTAPVIAAQKADQISENEWYVSFVMPSGSKIGHLPFPNDSNVILRELDKETCAAMSFRGRADEDLRDRRPAGHALPTGHLRRGRMRAVRQRLGDGLRPDRPGPATRVLSLDEPPTVVAE